MPHPEITLRKKPQKLKPTKIKFSENRNLKEFKDALDDLVRVIYSGQNYRSIGLYLAFRFN